MHFSINKQPGYHLILTRFNVPSEGNEASIRNKPNWLKDRFELFDRFCYPSVEKQNEKKFKWLIFFDTQTPDEYKKKIYRYESMLESFTPIFVEVWNKTLVDDAIKTHTPKEIDFLLTTRLDNDDGLHLDYTKELQASASRGEECFYNFENGLLYNSGKFYRHHHTSNAFISRLEKSKIANTVWEFQHQTIVKTQKVIQMPLQNAWLQVIHDTNVSNKTRGSLINSEFAVNDYRHLPDIEIKQISKFDTILENTIFGPTRALRDNAINAIKSVISRN